MRKKDVMQDNREGLLVEGLCKKYKNFQLNQISFKISPGSIMGLLGRNGAGKSTTIKILMGQTAKKQGKIWIDGLDMDEEPLLVKSKTGFVMEENMFLENKSLWENGILFGRFYENFSETEWKRWLKICNLQASAGLNTLSKGEHMKFQFAFAMAHHPRLLLLDEPTGNLDPVFRKEFLRILQEVVEEEQISVLFSSHLTSDLEQAADQITLMEQGNIRYTASMEEMMSQYRLVKGGPEEGKQIKAGNYPEVAGIQLGRVGFEAMVDMKKCKTLKQDFPELLQEDIDLSKWMYYMTKGGDGYESQSQK